MCRKLSVALLCLAAGGWVAPAVGEEIYRCGASYSQQPCPGGKLVPADDARSAEQGRQASLAAQRDAKAADAMEKARLKEEAKPVQGYIPARRADDAQEQEPPVKWAKGAKPAHFTAVAPRKPGESPARKKKAKKKKAA